ncbi:HEAT repeat [Desulfatibacillum alkenivorans DSM 16219]|jgi:HEAT repeat protein|uniref:HEAT repeat n=1 Tax=Desulfatibacillum alkenivorans DSM 16219 TaxID=1121393 RepID=A0A1M6IUP2_9BACT|nr:HEAT repeat domain-containing protein [Desulfatibacillum alkenivorans]SHJ38155.1 HEAT repeat [Desulfatibacillum alkenivorans DSM 16219]
MAKVILLQPRQRLLERARNYVDSPDLFAENMQRAVRELIKVLPVADGPLRHKIMILLAGYAKDQAVEPLYGILKDEDQPPRTRHYAAVQLCAVLPFVKDAQPVIDLLEKDLVCPDANLRRYATTAMGWQCNTPAFVLLTRRLYDDDLGVRLAAVNSLCNCGDARALPLLLERLEEAPLEEKRAILFNLWRLERPELQLSHIYKQYLTDQAPELRLAALALLTFSHRDQESHLLIKPCLSDEDHRVRRLALERLMDCDLKTLGAFEQEIRRLLNDSNMDIKRSALNALKMLEN